LLIAAGADPSKQNLEGMTALHHVVENSPIKAITLLLENGVDVNAKHECDGKMALHTYLPACDT